MQRKCIKHVRKPLSKQAPEEGKEPDLKNEEVDEKEVEKEKEPSTKERFGDLKDWKRNGGTHPATFYSDIDINFSR